MSENSTSADSAKTPLEWIQLELIPLPHLTDEARLLLWWNPDKRELRGDGKEKVLQIIEQAVAAGQIENAGSVYAVTDPLAKPSELAVVLAKIYWVVPQPVRSPGDVAVDDGKENGLNRLQ